MSARTFQLYMLWFRFLQVIRTSGRAVRRTGSGIVVHLPVLLRWIGSIVFAPLWISLELYILAWRRLEHELQARNKIRLHSWQRAVFCVTLSLTVGQAALLVITGASVSDTTFLLALVHGFAAAIVWKRGLRWSRKILGVRPVRAANSDDPYAGLDLGN